MYDRGYGKQPKEKVLVLAGSLGHGHLQAAHAIREAARTWCPQEAEVHVVDYLEQVSPHLHTVGSYCFVQWLKMFPNMYGLLFEMTRRDHRFSQLIKNVPLTRLRPLIKLIRKLQPTIIVSTFPAASAAVSRLKERGAVQCGLVTVITDHTDHSFWIHPHTDRYLVGSEEARAKLAGQGIPASRIEVSGIPVRPEFYGSYDKAALRRRHGLDTKRMTVLLMGGGCGLLDPEFFRAMEETDWAADMQFIVICGRNERLRRHLEEWAASSPLQIRVEGYVQPVHEYMAMSDLLITKPGGVTTTEAVVQRLPLLIYKPLPGQEMDNIRYLVRKGLACQAEIPEDLVSQLSSFASRPEALQWMSVRAQAERQHTHARVLEAILQVERHPIVPRRTARLRFRRNYV
ncbi:MGDG synthase family glycosyltransferase [Paenibacillus popilliae]|uniref:UDP-N-acetylglucosamine n=1 Tax=Paenibacillus popilliae ATCC 14706 TaxID=1212764 RepID=M9M3Z8_PAEPP|nr:glycosyltransferase [Paenibacillus popilliae]GAC41998.1 UDP-N-acetylglucosamine [Paenibacillus popilliae ATCC 14706]